MLHIMLNNAAHDSVGGHPTGAEYVDWVSIAMACGYDLAASVEEKATLKKIAREFIASNKLCFLEIKVAKGHRANLGRPKETPAQMKRIFCGRLTFMYYQNSGKT